MASNWHAQVDEIQALSSIWPDDFRILSIECAAGDTLPAENVNGKGNGPIDAASLLDIPAPLQDASRSNEPWRIVCQMDVKVEPPPDAHAGWTLSLPATSATTPLTLTRTSSQAESGESVSNEGNEAPSNTESVSNAPTCCVKHLPPLNLELSFNQTYPESEPPGLVLTAMWLNSRQKQRLKARLSRLWEEHGKGTGLPIVFTWADWLQHEAAAELLNEDNTLVLEHDEKIHGGVELTATRGGVAATATGGRCDWKEAGRSKKNGGDHDRHIVATPDTTLQGNKKLEANANQQTGGGHEDAALMRKLMALVQYSAAHESASFRNSMHTCAVCFDDKPGVDFVRLDCPHAFCRDCLSQQASVHVGEGSLDALRCPDPDCTADIGPHVLKMLLDDKQYQRWEDLSLKRALDSMSDAAYCPRCGTLSIEDTSENCADCPKCFFVFCTLCNEGRHPGVACVSIETKLEMLRQKAKGGGASALEELRRREHEFLSMREVEKSSKPCPSCGARIQRDEGCNKVVCTVCHVAMCWRCGKQISGYEHFREGSACVLFDQDEILRWERQMALFDGHGAAAVRNEYVGGFGHAAGAGDLNPLAGRRHIDFPLMPIRCPNCGQDNYRINGNNHMHCWSCTKHFCGVCSAVLPRRGGGMHFRVGGCRQHL